jgi:hypothetical protein
VENEAGWDATGVGKLIGMMAAKGRTVGYRNQEASTWGRLVRGVVRGWKGMAKLLGLVRMWKKSRMGHQSREDGLHMGLDRKARGRSNTVAMRDRTTVLKRRPIRHRNQMQTLPGGLGMEAVSRPSEVAKHPRVMAMKRRTLKHQSL